MHVVQMEKINNITMQEIQFFMKQIYNDVAIIPKAVRKYACTYQCSKAECTEMSYTTMGKIITLFCNSHQLPSEHWVQLYN